MSRPIAISLSPNAENDDVLLALKTLLMPLRWLQEKPVAELEEKFAKKFGDEYKAVAFNSGRAAQELILKALGIGTGDEVLVQGFTCVAVPNSVSWVGATASFADSNDSFGIDADSLRERVSENTKAIVVQHSFGIPTDVNLIKQVTRKGIVVIEDCAVALGAMLKGKLVGTLGDVSFFSFGRDKVVSSVFGGMVLTKDVVLYKRIKSLQKTIPSAPRLWIMQQLLHPILFTIILSTYNLGLGRARVGRILLYVFQKLQLLSFPVYPIEKNGGKPSVFPAKMPGALAILALHQLDKLERFNKHRQKIASYYRKELRNTQLVLPPDISGSIWLRFPIRHDQASELFTFLRKNDVLVGDWYRKPIVPVNDLLEVGYKEGMCPNSEKYAKTIINLPTYPTMTMKDAKRVVELVKTWLTTK